MVLRAELDKGYVSIGIPEEQGQMAGTTALISFLDTSNIARASEYILDDYTSPHVVNDVTSSMFHSVSTEYSNGILETRFTMQVDSSTILDLNFAVLKTNEALTTSQNHFRAHDDRVSVRMDLGDGCNAAISVSSSKNLTSFAWGT
jgi:hypothetical protein